MSFSVASSSISLARFAKQVMVIRYKPAEAEDLKREILPNVRCISVEHLEGAQPGRARFRYAVGDPLADPDDPQRFEQLFPVSKVATRRVVEQDDRLVVRLYSADGSFFVIFDGFVEVFQADVGSDVEGVTFEAAGTPIREWDRPLPGALMRHWTIPDEGGAFGQVYTNLPARFNPEGHPNATAAGDDVEALPAAPAGDPEPPDVQPFPCFLGPIWPPNAREDDKPVCKIHDTVIRPWTIAMACRYVMMMGNAAEEYVTLGSIEDLTSGLVAYIPKPADGMIDLTDSETFATEDIEVEDYDCKGEAWPVAVQRLIEPYGFAMRFDLETTEDGDPRWQLAIYRKDDDKRIKDVYLQLPGEDYDPGQTNVNTLTLARDASDVENQIILDTALIEYEVSVMLLPGFGDIDPSDADNLKEFIGAGSGEAYRLFIADEVGEGHWSFDGDAWVSTSFNFSEIFPQDEAGRKRVRRRRPGKSPLISTDAAGKPIPAQLHVSKDYAGPERGIWIGTGTWQLVNSDGWSLLDDRLGIRINAEDPNSWSIGAVPEGEDKVYDEMVIKLVDLLSNPAPGAVPPRPLPKLRLTCVIEDDWGIDAVAKRRMATPSQFTIEQRHDVSDQFRKRIVSMWSGNASPNDVGKVDEIVEDDTAKAKAHAAALRRARESGTHAGSITMIGVRRAYAIGDKVKRIVGRDALLRNNLGSEQKESAVLPTIVGIRYDLAGEPRTILSLADRRGEPPPRRRKAKGD